MAATIYATSTNVFSNLAGFAKNTWEEVWRASPLAQLQSVCNDKWSKIGLYGKKALAVVVCSVAYYFLLSSILAFVVLLMAPMLAFFSAYHTVQQLFPRNSADQQAETK